jgi:serine/threonine protein kinase
VRTPIRPRDPEPTISAFKNSRSSIPEAALLKTELQNIEVSLQPVVPNQNYPKVRGYEILSIVGYGGMGIVYEARHRELNRRVAIKTLRGDAMAGREFRERFRAEAEAIARLQHPNIIQVFEVGTVEQQSSEVYANPFIALEFVDGGSLIQHTRTPQSPRYAARIVETLARAAHSVHVLGIIHRDLKPGGGQPAVDASRQRHGDSGIHGSRTVR